MPDQIVVGDKIRLRDKNARSNPPMTKSRAYELRALFQTFGLPEYPVLAGPYARVFDRHSRARKSKPEKFTYCRCPTRHSVLKSEIVNSLKFLRGKHDL
jgi:hypothetical protein